MAILSIYDTQKMLSGVIPANKEVRQNWLQTWFANRRITEDKTVNFDVEFSVKNVMGMNVSPDSDVTPIMLPDYGHQELSFSYAKEGLNSPDYEEINTRRLGQALGTVDVVANQVANIREKLSLAEQRFENLFELNAANVLFYGTHTAVSEKHPAVFYDYGRIKPTDANEAEQFYVDGYAPELDLTTLNGNGGVGKRAWDSTGGTKAPTPYLDIIKMVETADRRNSPRACVVSSNMYQALEADINTNYKDAANLTLSIEQRISLKVLPEVEQYEGLVFKRSLPIGQGRSLDIYVYNGTYNDRMTGAKKNYVPSGYVVMLPNPDLGVRVYGRIMHERAQWRAQPRFINTWEDPKTGKREWEVHMNYLQGHTDINSVVSWKVGQ